MSKILLTGATGFVGRALLPALINAGHDLRCVVTRKMDCSPYIEQFVIDALESQADWSEALQGIDIVIHLAARVHIMKDKSTSPFEDYCKVNSLATKNLAEQAAQQGVKRFVFLSSIKVNGEFTVQGAPFTENLISEPDDPYALSKLYAERYLLSIAKKTDMDVVILRPPLIYGPGVKANFLKMLQLVEKGWPLPFGQVKNKRSFIFIDNLISVIKLVTTEANAANQIYLVSDDESWSLSSLLSFLANEMKVKIWVFAIPGLTFVFKLPGLNKLSMRLFGSLEVDNTKLKSELGWSPPISGADGLSATVAWYRNEYQK